ncbi:cytochrome P450 [Streptomyces sp. AK02-01A]|uniref:cytochrome P450 n=1 Tax=Streptomyces sp. AK02-01A TaxID=3028648 RepID=UPI0029CA3220|nr:cytochrome P450 [Streptomyces sp. AK02-01A]
MRRVKIAGGREALLVTRYSDVKFVLADQRFSRLAYSKIAMAGVPRESLPLVTTDPPDHTRRRSAVAHAFTAHRVRSMRALVEEVVAEAVSDLAAGPKPVDLVERFARPITMVIMCRVLGLPEKDQDRFEHWGNLTVSAGRYPMGEMIKAHQEMHEYFDRLVTERQEAIDRGRPTDDVLSQMLVSTHPDRQVSRAETVSQISGIFYAGYESTSSQMGSAVFELPRRPEVANELRTRPDRAVPIVEELLRYLTIAENGGMHHVATEDITLPDGSLVRSGEIVIPIPDATAPALPGLRRRGRSSED